MRLLLPLILVLPVPALADRYELASRVTAVTLYPQGAQVTRRIAADFPAGLHELVIPDLPAGTDPAQLRITAPDGLRIGSMRLAEARQPATGDLTPPEIRKAEAEVTRLEAALRSGEQQVQLLLLRAEAAEARALFLRAYGKDGATAVTGPEHLRALAETIGAEILDARETALRATFDADAAARALDADRRALDLARQALAALQTGSDRVTLTLGIETAHAGPFELTLAGFTPNASWQPVYDLRLNRGAQGAAARLQIDRGVLIGQYSGEDWLDVALTLSTARPSGQSQPSVVYPQLLQIYDPGRRDGMYERAADAPALAGVAAPAPAPEPVHAGTNVSYAYPGRVDLRDGVDALRLELGGLELAPEVIAAATPLLDSEAYILALTENSSAELLLPGHATLWQAGEMVGQTRLPQLAPGERTEIGFGPLDGMRVTRRQPQRSAGDSGYITRSSQRDESVEIEIRNLTAESWPLRLIDRVPHSEQEALTIRWSAEPAPAETDRDGWPGILAWRLEMAPGETRQIRLGWQIRWPADQELK